MPPIAKLLSIFTKKIKPKGSFRPLSIPAYKMSPTIKSIAQQLYDTINCRRYGYNINNKLSGVANEGLYSIFHWRMTDQQLANDWPILCHFLSVLLAQISVLGQTWLKIYPSLTYLLILWNFSKYFNLTLFLFCFSDVVAINMLQVLCMISLYRI